MLPTFNKNNFIVWYDKFIREPKLMLKYYSFNLSNKSENGNMIFVADGKFPHGGMFDRLKGIISVYAAAKELNKDFRINFTHPFELEKYLIPNKYDWRLSKGEVYNNIFDSRLRFMYGEASSPYRLIKFCKKNQNFYYGADSLNFLNNEYGTDYRWSDLYHELFKPTLYLQKYIDSEKKKIGTEYIAIHLRFMNLLGDKTEFTHDPTLYESEQNHLLNITLNAIKEIRSNNINYKILLATDSSIFVEKAKTIYPDIYTIPGEIKHIGTSDLTSDSANIKMFLDYYIISGAKKVYNIVGPGMWKSAFPEYSAKIGNTLFHRYFI